MACRTCNLPAPGLPSLVSDFHLNAGPRPVELFMVLSGIGRGTAFSRRRPRLSSDDLDAFGANFCLTTLFLFGETLVLLEETIETTPTAEETERQLESPKNLRRQGSGIYVACTFWLLCRLIIFVEPPWQLVSWTVGRREIT